MEALLGIKMQVIKTGETGIYMGLGLESQIITRGDSQVPLIYSVAILKMPNEQFKTFMLSEIQVYVPPTKVFDPDGSGTQGC